jgi:hypothetical protein
MCFLRVLTTETCSPTAGWLVSFNYSVGTPVSYSGGLGFEILARRHPDGAFLLFWLFSVHPDKGGDNTSK